MRRPAGMVDESEPDCVVLLGPTASGKTSLGVHIAGRYDGEILSADSRQVYRYLDIGSGKDLSEYGPVAYHLIDVAELPGEYSVYNYQKDFYAAFSDVRSRGRLPVVVGGTGMYLDSIIRGYALPDVPVNESLRSELTDLSLADLAARLLTLKSDIHNHTDLLERERLVRAIEIAEYRKNTGSGESAREGQPSIKPVILGIRFERSVLRARIRTRLEERISSGLIDEVRAIHESGISWERLERLGLEYRFTAELLQGKIADEKTYLETLYIAIAQFAKRQETWFRGMERKGVRINWIDEGKREETDRLLSPLFGTR